MSRQWWTVTVHAPGIDSKLQRNISVSYPLIPLQTHTHVHTPLQHVPNLISTQAGNKKEKTHHPHKEKTWLASAYSFHGAGFECLLSRQSLMYGQNKRLFAVFTHIYSSLPLSRFIPDIHQGTHSFSLSLLLEALNSAETTFYCREPPSSLNPSFAPNDFSIPLLSVF